MAKQVFMVAGQSNARGGPNAVSVDTSLFDAYSDCQFWHRNSITGGDDGTASTANEDLDNIGTTDDWGIELSMGRSLVKLGVSEPLILKVTSGGTSLHSHWRAAVDSGGTSKPWLVHLKTQWTAMLAANAGATAKALVWMQGESDVQTTITADPYDTRLQNMIAEIRSHVGVADLPIYITTMAPNFTGTYLSTVEAAQVTVANADDNVHLIDLDDMDDHGDNTHFDAKSLDLIGDRLANRYVTDYGTIPGAVQI